MFVLSAVPLPLCAPSTVPLRCAYRGSSLPCQHLDLGFTWPVIYHQANPAARNITFYDELFDKGGSLDGGVCLFPRALSSCMKSCLTV